MSFGRFLKFRGPLFSVYGIDITKLYVFSETLIPQFSFGVYNIYSLYYKIGIIYLLPRQISIGPGGNTQNESNHMYEPLNYF